MRGPVDELTVWRQLETGKRVSVGRLAQNAQGIFFSYTPDYFSRFGNLSPFRLYADARLQKAQKEPHGGLHGVFADSLPDGWGLLLQDRWFRRQGMSLSQITPMDRLALVGANGLGALQYTKALDIHSDEASSELAVLGLAAQKVFAGEDHVRLDQLLQVGSSGGARPKAQIYTSDDHFQSIRLRPEPGDIGWIVKFTTERTQLAHEEGLCEAAMLTLAAEAGLDPVDWRLVDAESQTGATQWLAVRRFDQTADGVGRLHMASAAGLLDVDFRLPSLDYADLIPWVRQLCQSPATAQRMFRRALFNVLIKNQDDHAKNISFLQNDAGRWDLSPAYDLTFSPHPFDEHATAFQGYGARPPVEVIDQLGERAAFPTPKKARAVMRELIEVVIRFEDVAQELGISRRVRDEIRQAIDAQCDYYASRL